MKLLIGWDMQDITPAQPVELMGQYYQRISKGVRDPLKVTALALEQKTASTTEQCVMASMDIVGLEETFLQEVRSALRDQVPGLNTQRVFLNATHVHTGPAWFSKRHWWAPAAHTLKPEEVRSFLLRRVVRVVANAWGSRRPGFAGWASAYAPTGFCRRSLYADGHAEMYGETNRADFIGLEVGNDPEVRMLFTWNERDQLSGLIANVACPAQVLEAGYVVSGDFFGELRRRVQATYGPQVHLLAQVSAAGDQSPRNLPAQAHNEPNYWNESGLLAVADRLEKAVAEGHEHARRCRQQAPIFKHTVTPLVLPIRRAGVEERRAAGAEVEYLTNPYPDEATAARELFSQFVADIHASEKHKTHGPFDNKELEFVRLENAKAVIERYENQERMPGFAMELHAVRLGDCAFVTNPFELYLDYGQMIHARSRAKKTFLVQLACGWGGYLPTARAAAAGGYGSLIINGRVGPEGGRMLVEASLKAIDEIWSGELEQRTRCGQEVSVLNKHALEIAVLAQ
jgi:hypothetical protein